MGAIFSRATKAPTNLALQADPIGGDAARKALGRLPGSGRALDQKQVAPPGDIGTASARTVLASRSSMGDMTKQRVGVASQSLLG